MLLWDGYRFRVMQAGAIVTRWQPLPELPESRIRTSVQTVKMNKGIIELDSGCFYDSKTARAAIDLKRIIYVDESNPEQWDWEHATWVKLETGSAHYLNIAFDDLLELWRAALDN